MPTPTLERLLKERVSALVGEELAAVEEEIGQQLDSPVGLIREMGEYIAGAGGKRLRPMLLLLAARVSGYRGPRSVRLGCVVELLHTATLIHDDVVDEAPLRRGRPSANARWGDDASVLVGDHLYSKSFAMPAVQTALPYNSWLRQCVIAWPLLPGVQKTAEILSPRNTQWWTFTPFPLAMIAT